MEKLKKPKQFSCLMWQNRIKRKKVIESILDLQIITKNSKLEHQTRREGGACTKYKN